MLPQIEPQVTWGTSPEMVVAIDVRVPDPAPMSDPVKREAANGRCSTWD